MLLAVSAACADGNPPERSRASRSPAAEAPVPDSMRLDATPAEDEPAPAAMVPGPDVQRYPPAQRIASRAEGAPQASLWLEDRSCVPGHCKCLGEFGEEWQLDDWGVGNDRLAEGSACVAADFDRDGDWDPVIVGGEGFWAAIMMEGGEPSAFILLDLGDWPTIVGPGPVSEAVGAPILEGPAILVGVGDDRVALFRWSDGTFTRQYLERAPR